MKNKQNTIYYFGPINTDTIAEDMKENLYVGPASRKVLSVLTAIHKSANVGLVTTPFVPDAPKFKYYKSTKQNDGAITIYQQTSVTHPLLNKIVASFNYLSFALFRTKKNDVILLYNFYLEYIPLAFVLWMLGRRPFLDIEDYPTDKKNIREVLGKYSYHILRFLCNPNIVAASSGILSLANAEEGCIVHGTVKENENAYILRPPYTGELRIQFSGTLNVEAGHDLFIETVKVLRKRDDCIVSFFVTGYGELETIEQLALANGTSKVKVLISTNLALSEYSRVLQSCHASLNLRIPGGVFSNTTFPSKVIEITANSLVLISTKANDVELIYKDAAILLESATEQCLAQAIVDLAKSPEAIIDISHRGHTRTLETYEPAIVGAKMIAFFKKHQKGCLND